ncbi:MAG TPA: adenylosuccinate synthase [Tepidisphaeraceae bacterium]
MPQNPPFSSPLDGNSAVVGLQWGDEGKGKIVDYLAEQADVVARYCGGANAGHSVVIDGVKHSTHLLPVGVFRAHTLNVIGNGVVLDPQKLLEEIDTAVAKGFVITPQTLKVSYKTHVVMPWHKLEDAARETAAGAAGIGTTKRGIGPCYADKMHRTTAIRVADLLRPAQLAGRIEKIVADKNRIFAAMYDEPAMDAAAIVAEYCAYGQRLAPFVDDTGHVLIEAWKAGKKILFEGAHAALLDVDHGTYPYVTSSNCSTLGLFTGAGVPPQCVRQFIGIMKAYSTRVGGGPFPTEQENKTGEYIRERGNEYGTTTRRPRRCGWFDAVAVKYSADLCGATSIALTLLDVLSGLPELQICTGYTLRGQPLAYFRADMDTLAEVQAQYETLPGWKAELSACKTYADLPAEAKAYVERLEQLISVPITMVSVGPDRRATLMR